ncbi:hypothetical protein CHRY9390_00778 [Chryseobacterium aquaeductus]|uniref:DUF4861 domain-containing protein n=1 Tax=Chryseobacterium aquaeductus TaxID=2675056 RepID=A0A9N8MEJ3_9FLAO|nr:DUF4861 family protein [Chryseobacterium aquaeductus]CAA7330125.1 hypothetical protein CHRY9390_00778 [Chryseobacterium potabilaquae]CAD7801450.1 hypothetical protein CHRY9390_00778 [Chryseobacterium aquaeductus]
MSFSKKFLFGVIYAIDCAIGTSLSSQTSIKVKNTQDFSRSEIVSISVNQLRNFLSKNKESDLRIKDAQNEYQPIQWVDDNGDGKNDELLFQANLDSNKTNLYTIFSDPKTPIPESKLTTYSRLVPERADDYTWENDKIAFRVYGPKGQAEALAKVKSSTLSSGVDIWLKRTEKSVINEWYKGYLTDPLYYHKDTRGEGYDPYHVGASRGTGGIGIWENEKLQVSKNFVTSKTITEGPLRTVFELTYAPWSEFGVKETKRISLDLGSNFSMFESTFESEKPVPNYTVGITLHKNEGESKLNDKSGYYLHWEKIDDAFVGEGIVIDPKIVQKSLAFKSETPDQSNLLVVTNPQKKLTYYAGFAWQKSGQIQTQKDWEHLLQRQTLIIANPLIITIY